MCCPFKDSTDAGNMYLSTVFEMNNGIKACEIGRIEHGGVLSRQSYCIQQQRLLVSAKTAGVMASADTSP
jgi:hypothetical protein